MRQTSSNVSKVGDRALAQDISSKVISGSRRLPLIIASLYYVFKALFSIVAFIPRVVLRKKLGERTFGFISIILAYIFLVFAQLTSDAFSELKTEFRSLRPIYYHDLGGIEDSEGIFASIAYYFINSAGTDKFNRDIDYYSRIAIVKAYKEPILAFTKTGLKEEFKVIWYIILIFSAFHFIELFLRKRRGQIINSRYRGDSIFSFLASKSILGFTIKNLFILMIVEPLFLYIISFLILSPLGFYNSAFLIKVFACFLFIEEYLVYSENKALALDIADSIVEGKIIADIQRRYEIDLMSGTELQDENENNHSLFLVTIE